MIPIWNTQGRAPYVMFSNGQRTLAHPAHAHIKLGTWWLLAKEAYGPANNAEVISASGYDQLWLGSVMEDQQDASGLLYRRNRYYDPATGRFTQEDPIGLAGGLNVYGFAAGDPVTYSDPFGLQPGCDHKAEAAEGRLCPIVVTAKQPLTTRIRDGWRRIPRVIRGVIQGIPTILDPPNEGNLTPPDKPPVIQQPGGTDGAAGAGAPPKPGTIRVGDEEWTVTEESRGFCPPPMACTDPRLIFEGIRNLFRDGVRIPPGAVPPPPFLLPVPVPIP